MVVVYRNYKPNIPIGGYWFIYNPWKNINCNPWKDYDDNFQK